MAQQQQKTTGTDLALRTAVENGFTETQLELIRNTAAKGCTPEEVAQLLIMARRTGLDPLARQLYMIKRGSQATPQTGIDGYRLVADRTERYAPGQEPTYTYDEEGKLWSATAYVKKFVGGTWHDVAATAIRTEYEQPSSPMWKKMPHVMLAKCAEALALRRAFPAELSGVYTAEEMAQADSEPTVTVEELSGPRSRASYACSDCGNQITRYQNMPAHEVAEHTLGKYKRMLCADCAKEERIRREAAKEDAIEAEYREAEKAEVA